MRYFLILAISLLLEACEQTTYVVDIKYQDSTQETIKVQSTTYPTLDDGCIYFLSERQAVRCGVKSFTYHTETLQNDKGNF